MGKVVGNILKTVGGSLLALVPGLQGLGAAIAFSGLTGLAGNALSAIKGKPKVALSASTGLTSRVSLDADVRQWLAIGQTALPTQMIYFGTSGSNNENLSMIFAHTCHPIAGYVALNINNIPTPFPTPTGAYAGILAIQTADGTHTANPFTTVHGGLWGASHVGQGLAMSHFRWAFDEEKLRSGLPQNIQFIAKTSRVYDPRRDSTRGGSGSHRADNEATWAYEVGGDQIGRNPALVELTYRLGWRKGGRLWAGMGEDPSSIDFASYIASANVCDEVVNGKPRYRIDGLLSLGEIHNINLGKIHATCGGKATDTGGLIGLWVAHDDTATALMTVDDGDWLGDIQWQPLPEGEVRNTARGSFVDAANFYQPAPYLEVRPGDLIALDNGEELADTLDFGLVQDQDQARRLASIRLRESRQGRLAGPAALKTLGLRPTNVISVARPRTGWTARRFRVETMGLAIDKTQLVLRDVASADYSDLANATPSSTGDLPTIGFIPTLGVLAYRDFVDFATEVTGAEKPANYADVTAVQPIVQNLSPTTGNALPTFVASDGNPFNRVVASGEARDGDAVTFAATLPAVPQVTFSYGGNAATAGQNIRIDADGLTASGFTLIAKSQGVTVGSTITDGSSTTGTGGEPARVINRTNAGNPYDGRFVFRYTVNVPAIAFGEPGTIEVGIYVKRSGVWLQAGTAYHGTSGTYNFAASPGAVDFGAGNEFGVGKISGSSGTSVNGFTSVIYTLGTVTETSLTPTGASPIRWEARL
ncbi:phage tail protein [Sandarakinorhabdus sp. DWP1-3-1]|uniref:phage tail protein n=1 Tax=Sandarakinorhabdus sp. DWP1-3-1 TaxID=2804627 RepID=UPI003CE9B506